MSEHSSYYDESPHKKDDLIGGKYRVYKELGHGGFGIVYLVYSNETKRIYALKTFKDEFNSDEETQELFRREAHIWTELDYHPYIVEAFFVDQIDGRLYIAMEYVEPNEKGLNSLQGYLRYQLPSINETLRWSIQFCYGMEFAYSRGIRCHRDIKPANIMITKDRVVKISDFGLAGVLATSKPLSSAKSFDDQAKDIPTHSIMDGRCCGTPTYMPPEQFVDAGRCDERSDIYSFGIVLYQMASQGHLPFVAAYPKDDSESELIRFWNDMQRLHELGHVPSLVSPLDMIIQRCLQKDPNLRFQNFAILRNNLAAILKNRKGETCEPPKITKSILIKLTRKGVSLARLGLFENALNHFNRALSIDPKCADAWINKGVSLCYLARFDEAISCYERALKIDAGDPVIWYDLGCCFAKTGQLIKAINSYEKAITFNFQYAKAWFSKGRCLVKIGRLPEALNCYNNALNINNSYPEAWYSKAMVEEKLGKNPVKAFNEFIRTVNHSEFPEWVAHARKRLQQLEKKDRGVR